MVEPIKIIPNDTNTDAIAILPGEHVSFFNIELPELPAKKLEKILPGIMADYVLGKMEDVHISLIDTPRKGEYLIAVCDIKWLDLARKGAVVEGKILKAIWPDYALLAPPEKDLAIMNLSGRVLARRADGTGFNISREMLDHVIGDLPFTEVFESRSIPKGTGLASGRYSARAPLGFYFRAMKRFTVLSVLALMIWLIFIWLNISTLDQEWTQYQNASVDLFKKTYPEVTRIVNVEAQMRALTENAGPGNDADFIYLADKVFKSVSESAGVTLENLSFDASGSKTILDISVSSFTFTQATSFEENLKTEGFKVSQGESTQSEENIVSRFVLEEGYDE